VAKNIVFCADGTWNGPGQGDESEEVSSATNVLKTFVNLSGERTVDTLKLSDEEESVFKDANGQTLQVAKYLHGVGDSDNFLVKILGGALGAGLITRVVRGYTFICRNYEPGDRIYLLGFSRGAYTARTLGGLISSQGLMDAQQVDLTSDKDAAYRWGAAVWYKSRAGSFAHSDTLIEKLENLVLDLPSFFLRPPEASKMVKAPVTAIGVWDTVGALGIPEYDLRTGQQIHALQFCDTVLNDNVAHGFHAVSVDERRGDFVPTLWNDRPGVVQRLFPGAHSDVGGGYSKGAESGLSDGALVWMTKKLIEVGVLFSAKPAFIPEPNPAGTAHCPWNKIPWVALPQRSRSFPAGLVANGQDGSIAARKAAGNVMNCCSGVPGPYAPGNL
jgi:uncharacterized protein (DUF2235 family)